MDRAALAGLLVCKGGVDKHELLQLSSTRWVERAEWDKLKRYEQHFLRSYATGAAVYSAVLAGRSAARVSGMWVLPTEVLPVELASPNGHPPPKKQWPAGCEYIYSKVPAEDIVENDGIRYTRPVRTALDIARLHGVREGTVAIDSLYYGKDIEAQREIHGDIARTLRAMSGMKGIGDAREAFELSTHLSESTYETLARLVLLDEGIVAQPQVYLGRYRVDLLWGQVVIEIDGRAKFEDTPHATVMAQLARENELKSYGYEVVRVFPDELWRRPAEVIARILEAKRRADMRGPASVLPAVAPTYD